MAQPIPGSMYITKAQTQVVVTSGVRTVPRAVAGFVTIITPSSVMINVNSSTSNYFTLQPGVLNMAFYNEAQRIYAKTSSGTVTLNVIVEGYR